MKEEDELKLTNKFIIQMSHWLSINPAQLFNIHKDKGSISIGKDADFVIWNPNESCLIDLNNVYNKEPENSIYLHHTLQASVVCTYLRGSLVYKKGEFLMKNGKVLRNNYNLS
jgi:dihydroorotase-like cyclic amidohydrolase